jgi:hypothetical protein
MRLPAGLALDGMERADLLELLYSASDRSQMVRATVTRWSDDARLRELLRARGEYRDPPPIPPEEGSWGEPPTRIEVTTKIWTARPDRLRWESEYVADGSLSSKELGVKDGDLYWVQSEIGGFQSNESAPHGSTTSRLEERLLDPAPLLGSFRVEAGKETSCLGRAAIRVRAIPRPGQWSHDFSRVLDELELVVDRERGVLLRVSERATGDEIARSEIVELAFDEPVAAELFRPPR